MKIEKILVVDDELIIGKLFKRLLGGQYEVVSVTSGKEAVEKLKQENFDVAFVDIVMPEMDGIETLKEIKKFSPGLVVIMMTGFAIDEKIREALSLGAFDFVYKPFADREIDIVLDKVIKKEKLKKL